MSRYLAQQKQVTNYLLKLSSKNRAAITRLVDVQAAVLASENKLRDLLQSLTEADTNG